MDERRKHGWLLWFGVGLILLPVVYVASFGPACWLSKWLPLSWWLLVAIFYVPLFDLCEYCEGVRLALKWYVSLWTDSLPNFLDR